MDVRCRQVRDRLSEYMDGRLKEGERRRVEEHLAACPECRWELEELRATVGLLRQLPPLTPRRSFTLSPAVVAPRVRLFPVLRMASLAAALLLLFLTGGEYLFTSPQRAAAPEMESTVPQAAPTPSRLGAPETGARLAPVPAPGESKDRGVAPSAPPASPVAGEESTRAVPALRWLELFLLVTLVFLGGAAFWRWRQESTPYIRK
ncbi:MAG: zf-HC2 domain-containing protein [Chloroflexi bacterium]|nr:zf-HC2 domain-containing protein [Chloroflexota bacterium]